MIPAIERGYPQNEIANASYHFQRQVESGERLIVGVNAVQQEDDAPIDVLKIDESAGRAQAEKLALLRRRRDKARVQATLDALRRGAEGSANTMPLILDCVKAYATVGEICDGLRDVLGVWTERAQV
jgi:methylmalonyl-CoA mutase N-terminal domain/subunit